MYYLSKKYIHLVARIGLLLVHIFPLWAQLGPAFEALPLLFLGRVHEYLLAEYLRDSDVEQSTDGANQACSVKGEAITTAADGDHSSKTTVHSLAQFPEPASETVVASKFPAISPETTDPVFHFAKARTTSAPAAQAMMVTRKMELTTGPSPAAFMEA